ncbi:hypothetical protein VTN77DRAFT_9485 [Rasamsonia byssochlamydoides]|uniref:uncharacterized protein n=1 Tax=Rasamsonia byssochlamydoides TaxID=89139 RepID=UPI003743C4FC
MATSSSANPESLAVLSDMVNQTLVDTGRFFRSSGSMQARAQLKAAIPAAYENFQLALDNLSEQIFIAKALLEKEYEAIKAKKAVAPSPEPATPPSEPKPAEDVTMAEAPTTVDATTQDAAEKSGPENAEQAETIPPEVKAETEAKAEGSAKSTPEKEAGKTEKQEETTKTGDQALPSTTGEEMNFDSMIPVTGDGANDFDLHLNFANDEIGNQNSLAGTNFMDSGAGGTMNAGGTSNEQPQNQQQSSISSLLPGLESYAANNAGDDFNIELQKFNNEMGQHQQSSGQQNTAQAQDNVMAPGESSFDDLFMEKDNNGGEGEGNLMGGDGLMDIGELDDSWFN